MLDGVPQERRYDSFKATGITQAQMAMDGRMPSSTGLKKRVEFCNIQNNRAF